MTIRVLHRMLIIVLAVQLCTACASGPLSTGTHRRTIAEKLDGFTRAYRVHVPPDYVPANPAPMVVMLHGAFSSGKQMAEFTGLDELADREGFIAVYPDGIGLFGLLRHWNSGQCCAKALADDIDDVGFLLRVIDEVSGELAVDSQRIYMIGHSNGGMLAYRFAAEHPERLAAVSAVSATAGGRQSGDAPLYVIPRPSMPVPVFVMHGLADEHMPYEGGNGPRTQGDFRPYSVEQSVGLWVEYNGCMTDPVTRRDGPLEWSVWTEGCTGAEVVLVTVDGWPHSWPGPHFSNELEVDDPLYAFDGLELIWEFLKGRQR